MIEKEKVRKNFGKSSKTYDEYAIIQKYMGEQLLKIINIKTENPKIYEIGCGTGLFTKMLVEKYPLGEYKLIDISEKMTDRVKTIFSKNNNIKVIVGDAEKYQTEETYDLVTSNAVFQWFENLENGILNIKKSINKGGKLYFSTFGEKTFCEMREAFRSIDTKYLFSQNFFNIEELENLLKKNFKNVILKEEFIVAKYNNLMEFLTSVKKVGANSARVEVPVITAGLVKKAETYYFEKYSENGKIKVTNHVVFVEAWD